jgi:nucleoside-diphosphate-sugar epimerase
VTDSRVVVLGAGGCVGREVVRALTEIGVRVVAVRRPGSGSIPAAEMLWMDLREDSAAERIAGVGPRAVISAAPIFHVASTLRRVAARSDPAIVACSSMSATSKVDSPSRADRAVAHALLSSERSLRESAARVTIVRPTMIYGHPATQNVARLQRLARTLGWLAAPRCAIGLRQPVHHVDVAQALVGALRREAPSRTYELGGGERLSVVDLISRVAAVEGARLVGLPSPKASMLGRSAARCGLDRLGGMLARAGQDQVADNSAATRDLGVDPRPFTPCRNEA